MPQKQSKAVPRKRFIHARFTEMFSEWPRKLAQLVIQDRERDILGNNKRDFPHVESLQSHYSKLWGRGDSSFTPALPASRPRPLARHFKVIQEEIKDQIRKMKLKSSPGLDGINKETLAKLRGIEPVLGKLYNLLLATRIFPKAWKKIELSSSQNTGRTLI